MPSTRNPVYAEWLESVFDLNNHVNVLDETRLCPRNQRPLGPRQIVRSRRGERWDSCLRLCRFLISFLTTPEKGLGLYRYGRPPDIEHRSCWRVLLYLISSWWTRSLVWGLLLEVPFSLWFEACRCQLALKSLRSACLFCREKETLWWVVHLRLRRRLITSTKMLLENFERLWC